MPGVVEKKEKVRLLCENNVALIKSGASLRIRRAPTRKKKSAKNE